MAERECSSAGSFWLVAAIIVWSTAIFTSPRGVTAAEGTEHIRNATVIYIRNASLGTIILAGLAAIMLFPIRRRRVAWRAWAIGLAIFVLIATSLYQLYWLRAAVGA